MKSLKQHISQVKTLHSLNEFIKDNKSSLISLNEKLIINKNYKMSSDIIIDDILSFFNKISKKF